MLPPRDAVPDLFVVSLPTPGRCEHEFARIRVLRAKMPTARWIMLCRTADIGFLRDAIESGINALLLEDSPGEALHFAADLVMHGLSFISVDLAKIMAVASPGPVATPEAPASARWCKLPQYEASQAVDRPAPPSASVPREWQVNLSDRESEILRGLVAGHPNKLIARDLQIAEATVKVHVKALLRKMQVTNRTQAAISALQFLRGTEDPGRSQRMLPPPSRRDDGVGPLILGESMPLMGEIADGMPQHYRCPNNIGD